MIQPPCTLFKKHLDVLVITLMLFFAGFAIGLVSPYGQAIVENARNRQIDVTDITGNFQMIAQNNGMIAAMGWVGWFVFPVFGINYFPPSVMIYSVGASFGAVASAVSPANLAISLMSFGVLEALSLVFGIAGGLLFPKYVALKLFKKPVSLSETIVDSGTLFLYAGAFVAVAAMLEAFLLNPATMLFAVVMGVLITVLSLWLIVKYR
ncbi:Uncharacterised protein [uncultured archaeon]|nr:Uncharacterised protein [uncultured archaeon]